MDKVCYVCKKKIKENEKFKFYELYGFCHEDCVVAKSHVIVKELGVKQYNKKSRGKKFSKIEQEQIIKENTIDELKN